MENKANDFNQSAVTAIHDRTLQTALDRGTTMPGRARGDRNIHIHSRELGKTEILALDQPDDTDPSTEETP